MYHNFSRLLLIDARVWICLGISIRFYKTRPINLACHCNETIMKSILKRPKDGDPELRGIRWDEDNIRTTEEQKDSTMKIIEPKTPFIHYDETTDKAYTNGISPFELEQAMSHLNPTSSQGSNLDIKEDDWSCDEEEEIGISNT